MMKSNLRLVGSDPNEDAWDVERQRYAEAEKRDRQLVQTVTFLVVAAGLAILGAIGIVF